MSAVLWTVLIVLASFISLALYVSIGRAIAQRALPQLWQAELREESRVYHQPDIVESVARGTVRARAVALIVAWPVSAPVHHLRIATNQHVDDTNPWAIEREHKRLRTEIRDMERRLLGEDRGQVERTEGTAHRSLLGRLATAVPAMRARPERRAGQS